MAYDPEAYPRTVLRARQRLVGPGGLADTTVIELYALLGQTLEIIAKEGDAGLITAERAERLRRSIMEHLADLGAEYAAVLDEATLATSQAVADLHKEATEGAFASVGAAGAKEVARAAASYTKVPGLTLQHMMARRSLGGAKTYSGLFSRGLGEMADAVDHTLVRGVARGISSKRLTLELAAQFTQGDKALLQYVTDGALRSAALKGFDDSMAAQTAKDLLQYGRMIAVSEINEAHRSAHVLAGVRSPVVGTAQWTRSGRHAGLKSSPCECDILAQTDRHGLGPGIFYLQNYPAAPHPHCACYPYLIPRAPKKWGTAPPAPKEPPEAITPAATRELFEELAAKYPATRSITDSLIKSTTKQTNLHLGLAHKTFVEGADTILSEQEKIAGEVRRAFSGSKAKARLDGLGARLEMALKETSPEKAADRLKGVEERARKLAEDPDVGASLTKKANALAAEAKARWAEIIVQTETDPAKAKEAAKALASAQRSAAGKEKKVEAAARALRKAETPTFPSDPQDTTVLKKLGGTTGAKLVEGPDKQKYVRKTGTSAGHLREEVYADRAYEALGVDVPPQRLYNAEISAAEGSSGGEPVKLSQYFDDTTELGALKGAAFEDAAAELRKNFVADALLANWDVLGLDYDNVLRVNSGPAAGRLLRIDNGGALRYRAQGKLKGDAFGPQVGEIETLRDPQVNPQAAKVFGPLTEAEINDQIVDVLTRRDELIAALPPELHDVMRARLKNLADRLPADKKAAAEEAVGGAAARQKAAVDRLGEKVQARIDANKNNVAGLKKTIAYAEAAQKKAKAGGNPALQAKAEVMAAKAQKALADKQLANKVSSKKYAAKKKLGAADELIGSDDPQDLEAAVGKAASALVDAEFAGDDALIAQAKKTLAAAEEALDATTGLKKEAKQAIAAAAEMTAEQTGSVKGLKAALAKAEDAVGLALDAGDDALIDAAYKAADAAEDALKAKQLANKKSSKKYAAKKKIEKADALIDEAPDGDTAALEDAIQKAQSALEDASFAGAPDLEAAAKKTLAAAEEALDAAKGAGKEIAQAAGKVADEVEDNLQNVSGLKKLIDEAEALADQADALGSPQAIAAAEEALKDATSALAAKQTANKVSSTKYAVKTALQKAEDAAAAGKAASAQKHLAAAEKKIDFLDDYVDTDFAVKPKEVAGFKQTAAALQKQIDTSDGGKGAAAAKEATAAKKAAKEAASEATKQGDTPTPPNLSDLTAAEKDFLEKVEENIHWAKVSASDYYTNQTIGALQAALDNLGKAKTPELKAYIKAAAGEALEKAKFKLGAMKGEDLSGAYLTKNRAFIELGASLGKKAKKLNSAPKLKKQIGYASAALNSANGADASKKAKDALERAIAALEKKLQAVKPAEIDASKVQPKGPKADPTWDVPETHQHFPSKPKVDAWGSKLFDTWAKKVQKAPQEYQGVKYYKGSGYGPMNRWLRGLEEPSPSSKKKLRERIEGVEKALSRPEAKVDRDMMTYRGLQFDKWYNAGEDLVGKTIKDEGILSTSPSREFAYDWGSSKSEPILMEIELPEGTRAGYLEKIWNRYEYEILLDRGAHFKVKEVRYEKKGYGDPFMVIRVEFLKYDPEVELD